MWVDEPLVPECKDIDVIYEVILKEGLNLNSSIEKLRIKNSDFYYIKDKKTGFSKQPDLSSENQSRVPCLK